MANKLRARKNLISLDGLDGCGKTSALAVVEQYLKDKFPEKDVRMAEGWGFNNFSLELKELMMRHKESISHNVLYNLFRAVWTDAWERYGAPVIDGSGFLVTDRWLLSTGVYQDPEGKLSSNLIQSTNALPGLTIILTASKDVAINRIMPTRSIDAFEKEYFEKHDELQSRFLRLADIYCDEYLVINTDDLNQEQVADVIRNRLDVYFGF